jgi:Tfp pilus assembly protein PilF
MSLLIKALQKAEQSKEAGALELAPHHDDADHGVSLADEGGFSEPIPAPAAPAAAKTGSATTEREAAANVFRAREVASYPGEQRAFWLGLGGLVLLLLLGIGFYFYLDSLQQPVLVAARRPSPALPISPAVQPASPTTAIVSEAAPVGPAVTKPPPPENMTEPARENLAILPTAEPEKKQATPPSAKPAASKPDTEESAVKVTRIRKSEPTVNATATAAYQAFMAGDDAAAARLYRQLLQSEPRNVDALLGLAVVAARQENIDEAAGHYARALELEPRNSVAQAGLIGLLVQADPVAAESRLKSLIAQQPDAAYLHATLGGIYTDQNLWPSAQQAYFQAFRLEPASAEYAFNLAVSLDQMGKSDLALDYYQRARDLLPKQGSTVDRAGLETRIGQLRSTLGK